MLYNDEFIFKFINIYKYIHISLSSICQSGYKLLPLSLLFCGCQRLLLPALTYQSFHLHAHRRPQPSSRDSIYSVSGLCFSGINIFMSSWPSYRQQTWPCETYSSTRKPTSAGMNVSREGSRDRTFPRAPDYFTRVGTDWFGKSQIRCRTTSDVKNRLSSPARRSETNKQTNEKENKQTKKKEYPT